MTIKSLPAAPEGRPFAREKPDLPAAAMERWNGGIRAARDGDNSISIFDVIGADYWGEGVTASRIAGALRSLGGADVTVNINSPGGDMFEGLAIYNLLREYDGKVTVKVLGLAASAASVIAMAGDDVQIGRGAFLMIHNCWVYAMGNRHDLAQIAADMEPFDKAMSDIYQARSGLDAATVEKMMDGETYIGGSDAVAKGFGCCCPSSRSRGWARKAGGLGTSGSTARRRRCASLMRCWPKPIRRALSVENFLKPYPAASQALLPSLKVRRALPKKSTLTISNNLKTPWRRSANKERPCLKLTNY